MRIRAFSDYHVHVRDGKCMRDVVPYTTVHCGRFMAMPNLHPNHIINAPQMMVYREMIRREIKHPSEVLMTISLVEETTPEMIKLAAEEGCTAVKLYPGRVYSDAELDLFLVGCFYPGMIYSDAELVLLLAGCERDAVAENEITTNSRCGISRGILWSLIETERKDSNHLVHRFWENLKVIEDSDLVLSIHGELPGEEVLNREKAMLPLVRAIFYNFKKIRVVLEHITTWDAVKLISELDYTYPGRIAATITPHHLMYTLTDLLGGKLKPHLFCKPVLKNELDRVALQEAAISGKECFFLGSDSAPWYRGQKECASGCAGVWNSPALVPTMFEIFDGLDSLNLLEDFTSTFGDLFYHKESVGRILNVERSEWKMESEIHGMVPFRAGQLMQWSVAG